MSLSKEERVADCNLALRLMCEAVGDKDLLLAECEIASPPFDAIRNTTWQQLEYDCLIKDSSTIGCRRYILTGDGWRKALDLNWDAYKTQFMTRLSTLSKALKDIVKGRSEDGYTYADALANQTGIPAAWISNVIEAKLLDNQFDMQGVEWYDDSGTIVIPLSFGLRPLDF